jgi:hypothetical protein
MRTLYSDDEIKLSKLQLKIDAQKSRTEIDRIRDSYKAPVKAQQETQQQEDSESDYEGMD